MLTKEQTAEMVSVNQLHPGDTGSTDVQVALLTERIRQLTDHLRVHRKDHHSQRGLMMLVGQRRGLLRYLSREEPARYKALIARLGLRK
jgi:small subunit ribosomal protein S15